MGRKPKLRKGQPRQTKKTGLEIPVSKRRDFMGNRSDPPALDSLMEQRIQLIMERGVLC
jgi:hypothetical protein